VAPARLGRPAFLWIAASAGSGELLFSPRIGALYGYTLLAEVVAD
jgi:hypothetical protein